MLNINSESFVDLLLKRHLAIYVTFPDLRCGERFRGVHNKCCANSFNEKYSTREVNVIFSKHINEKRSSKEIEFLKMLVKVTYHGKTYNSFKKGGEIHTGKKQDDVLLTLIIHSLSSRSTHH